MSGELQGARSEARGASDGALLDAIDVLNRIDTTAVLYVRVPSCLKGTLAAQAHAARLSLNKFCIQRIFAGCEQEIIGLASVSWRDSEGDSQLAPRASQLAPDPQPSTLNPRPSQEPTP